MREEMLKRCIEAVREAAQAVKLIQVTQPGQLTKADASPVTVADFVAQAMIGRQLKAHYPTIPLIAEESSRQLCAEQSRDVAQRVVDHLRRATAEPNLTLGQVAEWIDHGAQDNMQSTHCFTLDPIDGTKGFLRGDQYAICLALLDRQRNDVAMGIMACPNLATDGPTTSTTGCIAWAERGKGSWQQPLEDKDAMPQSLHVHGDANAQVRYAESFEAGHRSEHDATLHIAQFVDAKETATTIQRLQMDSQAKYLCLARGDVDVYWRWGALIVEEAGGKVTDIQGKPLDWAHGDTLVMNEGVLATSGKANVHDVILNAVAKGIHLPTREEKEHSPA